MGATAAEPLLSVKNLSKRFPVGKTFFGKPNKWVHAVNNVSFDIMPGETFSLVGESGCGKSTTSRLINRLITPDEGQIIFDGQDIAKISAKEMRPLRSKMQMVFQDPYGSLNPRMKVQDIIAEPLLVHTKLSPGERLKRVHELLEVVGLPATHGERYPHEFSGGQRQRIGIARALSVNPKLIMADEPVSALDVSIQAQVLNLLRDVQEQYNLTYLFISHDLAVVEMISDRIGVMYLGTIMEVAPNEELYSNPQHPYTQALLSAVPIPDPTIEKKHVLIEGDLPSPTNIPSGCPFHTRCPHATEKCSAEVPPTKEVKPGHFVNCHYPGREL
ncbi:ABC transporter ATP-binding protein [Candidatus Collinsella stercoripullorum]|uniref:ABC transporter ATP-binding protein n=1 Tax=Candidatus Collinsella stercoripullorum TaxID=2838522 RepID=UPI001C3B1C1B|nr:dipeptide ABC transporter ATP-binding protein [Candidatus Collinsella stercoripullorum]HJA00656.1 dipeptide ABC transporter ATP-binding protein [Candidatus Collinsella stercoripullorum]